MQVNNNGIITSDKAYTRYTPDHFAIIAEKVSMIAPFWADIETSRLGTVFFRTTTNSTLLARADEHVHNKSDSYRNFKTKELVIITWDRVGYWPITSNPKNKVCLTQLMLNL